MTVFSVSKRMHSSTGLTAYSGWCRRVMTWNTINYVIVWRRSITKRSEGMRTIRQGRSPAFRPNALRGMKICYDSNSLLSRRKSANGGVTPRKNTGRDGSPVGSVSVGSASPLADTGVAIEDAPVTLTIYETVVAQNRTYSQQSLQNVTSSAPMGINSTVTLANQGRGSGYWTKYSMTLISVSMTVPAHTRYTVPLNFKTYAYANNGRNNPVKYARGYVYSMGSEVENVFNRFYATQNNPSQYYFAGGSRSAYASSVTYSLNKSSDIHFDNPNGDTKDISQYFVVTVGCGDAYYNYNPKYYSRITLTGETTMQRLVPTSYDVEYDQLRHSLEEEYYEAIRGDENYPTEGVRVTSGYTGGWNGMANCID